MILPGKPRSQENNINTMKKYLLIAVVLSGCCSMKKIDFSTTVPINSETQKVDFTEAIEIDTTNKNELYSRAREWFAHTFISANDVLQMDDKDNGKLIGKATDKMPEMGANAVMHFTVSIYIKDNKYKYSFSDIHYEFDQMQGYGATARIVRTDISAEEIIIPNKINGCACMVARARAKWRDSTIARMNKIVLNLKASMEKTSTF